MKRAPIWRAEFGGGGSGSKCAEVVEQSVLGTTDVWNVQGKREQWRAGGYEARQIISATGLIGTECRGPLRRDERSCEDVVDIGTEVNFRSVRVLTVSKSLVKVSAFKPHSGMAATKPIAMARMESLENQ